MKSSSPKSAAERLIKTVAALSLGAAVVLAIFELVPLGAGALAVAAMAAGVAAAAAGFALLVAVDEPGFPRLRFDPIEFPCDVLLLDQPIAWVDAESRVTRLFISEPGEPVARIGHFANAGRAFPRNGVPQVGGDARPDASAELHAALAEIRQSLR